VPAEATVTPSTPLRSNASRNKISAIGLRQVFPVQISKTRVMASM